MANKTIPMYHPLTGGTTLALTAGQAAAFELSGWKRGEPPKSKASKKASK